MNHFPFNYALNVFLFFAESFLLLCRLFFIQVSGNLQNTGQSLVFRIDKDTKQHVNISGGPLAYRYQFEEIYIHYGIENTQGSEHKIHGYYFPGEVCFRIIFILKIFEQSRPYIRLNFKCLLNALECIEYDSSLFDCNQLHFKMNVNLKCSHTFQ